MKLCSWICSYLSMVYIFSKRATHNGGIAVSLKEIGLWLIGFLNLKQSANRLSSRRIIRYVVYAGDGIMHRTKFHFYRFAHQSPSLVQPQASILYNYIAPKPSENAGHTSPYHGPFVCYHSDIRLEHATRVATDIRLRGKNISD